MWSTTEQKYPVADEGAEDTSVFSWQQQNGWAQNSPVESFADYSPVMKQRAASWDYSTKPKKEVVPAYQEENDKLESQFIQVVKVGEMLMKENQQANETIEELNRQLEEENIQAEDDQNQLADQIDELRSVIRRLRAELDKSKATEAELSTELENKLAKPLEGEESEKRKNMDLEEVLEQNEELEASVKTLQENLEHSKKQLKRNNDDLSFIQKDRADLRNDLQRSQAVFEKELERNQKQIISYQEVSKDAVEQQKRTEEFEEVFHKLENENLVLTERMEKMTIASMHYQAKSDELNRLLSATQTELEDTKSMAVTPSATGLSGDASASNLFSELSSGLEEKEMVSVSTETGTDFDPPTSEICTQVELKSEDVSTQIEPNFNSKDSFTQIDRNFNSKDAFTQFEMKVQNVSTQVVIDVCDAFTQMEGDDSPDFQEKEVKRLRLEQERADAEREVKQVEEERQQASSQLHVERKKTSEQLKASLVEREKIVAEMKKVEVEFETSQVQIRTYETELNEVQEKLGETQKILQTSRSELQKSQTTTQSIKLNFENTEDRLKKTRKELETTDERLRKSEEEREQFVTQTKRLRSDLEKRKAKEEKERQKVDVEQKQAEETRGQLTGQVDNLKSVIERLRSELEKSKQNSEELAAELAGQLETEKQIHQSLVEKTEGSLEASIAKNASIESTLQTVQQELALNLKELQRSKDSAASLEKDRTDLRKELESQGEQLKQLRSQLETTQNEFENSQKELEHVQEELERNKEELEETKPKFERSAEQNVKLQSELDELSTTYELSQKELMETTTELSRTKTELEDTQTKLSETETAFKKSENERKSKEDQFSEKIKLVGAGQVQIDKLHEDLQASQTEVEQHNTDLSNLRNELANKDTELERTRASLSAGILAMKKSAEQLRATRSELVASQEDINISRTNLTAKIEELSKLRSDFSNTSDDLDNTRNELKEARTELGLTRSEMEATLSELGSVRSDHINSQSDLGNALHELNQTTEAREKLERVLGLVRGQHRVLTDNAQKKDFDLLALTDKIRVLEDNMKKKDYDMLALTDQLNQLQALEDLPHLEKVAASKRVRPVSTVATQTDVFQKAEKIKVVLDPFRAERKFDVEYKMQQASPAGLYSDVDVVSPSSPEPEPPKEPKPPTPPVSPPTVSPPTVSPPTVSPPPVSPPPVSPPPVSPSSESSVEQKKTIKTDFDDPLSGMSLIPDSMKGSACKEFFFLTCLSIKMNKALEMESAMLNNIRPYELFDKASAEHVQFHQYHDWIIGEMERRLNDPDYKKPAPMVVRFDERKRIYTKTTDHSKRSSIYKMPLPVNTTKGRNEPAEFLLSSLHRAVQCVQRESILLPGEALTEASYAVVDLTMCIERCLVYGIQQGLLSFVGFSNTFWEFIKEGCEIAQVPELRADVNLAEKLSLRTPQGKGRAFIRLALKHRQLHIHMRTLVEHNRTQSFVRSFYTKKSIVGGRSDEFLAILDLLGTEIMLDMTINPKILDTAGFWKIRSTDGFPEQRLSYEIFAPRDRRTPSPLMRRVKTAPPTFTPRKRTLETDASFASSAVLLDVTQKDERKVTPPASSDRRRESNFPRVELEEKDSGVSISEKAQNLIDYAQISLTSAARKLSAEVDEDGKSVKLTDLEKRKYRRTAYLARDRSQQSMFGKNMDRKKNAELFGDDTDIDSIFAVNTGNNL